MILTNDILNIATFQEHIDVVLKNEETKNIIHASVISLYIAGVTITRKIYTILTKKHTNLRIRKIYNILNNYKRKKITN